MYARSDAQSVMEQAFLATELRAHRQEDLQKRIEANLPGAVLAIHQHKHLQVVVSLNFPMHPSSRSVVELNTC